MISCQNPNVKKLKICIAKDNFRFKIQLQMNTKTLLSSLSLTAAVALLATTASAQFYADFETDVSADWEIFTAYQGRADFNFDYSTAGIPLSPNAKAGDSTRALRLEVNWDHNTSGQYPSISVSPKNQSFSGDFVLQFDIWSNSVGPISKGAGSGATMINGAGIGTNATSLHDPFSPNDGLSFWTDNEGDISNNYRIYPAANQSEGQKYLAAPQDGSNLPSSHLNSYYSQFGGHEAPVAQVALFPGQTGTTAIGTQGMAWHTWQIAKSGDTVTWTIDGLLIATVTNYSSLGLTGDNILFGRFDPFWGASADPNGPAMNFTLIDNIMVIPEPSTYAAIFGGLALLGAIAYRSRKARA